MVNQSLTSLPSLRTPSQEMRQISIWCSIKIPPNPPLSSKADDLQIICSIQNGKFSRKQDSTALFLWTNASNILTFDFSCDIKPLTILPPMMKQKLICYTLDLEHDYAGLSPSEQYETFSRSEPLKRLSDIIRRHDLKITAFATGKVLNDRKETVEYFRELGTEIELHGYHHIMFQPDLALEVQKGAGAYRRYFGKNPLGYRSPGGVFSPVLLKTLAEEGIRYDSSLIPSFRLGVYKNLKSPITPFHDPTSPIFELPIGVVPKVRLPVAASYIRLFGLSTYKLLFALFGTPSPLVYLFHLVDLIPTKMRRQLSPFWRYVYAKGQRRGFEVFEASVKYFSDQGYKSEYMSTLYNAYSQIPEARFAKKPSIR